MLHIILYSLAGARPNRISKGEENMIRWFKRKEKKDRWQKRENLRETETGEKEEPEEEDISPGETLVQDQAAGAQTVEGPEPETFAPAEGGGQDNSLSGKQAPPKAAPNQAAAPPPHGEEETLEEEGETLEEEDEATEDGVPKGGERSRPASGADT